MVMCCPLSSPDENSAYAEQFSTTHTLDCECIECGATIRAGIIHELYECRDTDEEDERDIYRTCAICVEIRDHFACDGWIFGQLWDDLEDNFFPDMRMGGPCMAGLSPAAKDAIVSARMEWLFDSDEMRPVALPPWWRWWYGDAEQDEGRH